jgi:argininosuccinate lyase
MKAWSGRFSEDTDELMVQFNASLPFDYQLLKEDIAGSKGHAKMLEKIGILSLEELTQIDKGLEKIEKDLIEEMQQGSDWCDLEKEDIHMLVESRLTELIGDVGKKLHTARSRNDQVAVDLKLYLINASNEVIDLLVALNTLLIELSEMHMSVILPGYTHLQRAQPIRLSFYLMAYFQMFKRDIERLEDGLKRLQISPLGSGALAGVSYESDRFFTAKLLGFDEVSDNALDAVSDRDHVIEFNATAAIIMMHLSRMAEEMIIWSTSEFSFIKISDKFTTGSSIMPQKKNPDAAELIRGKTGRVYGNLVSILTVMKALPLAYNKDMQEDKEGVFDTVTTIKMCLNVMTKMWQETTFDQEKMLLSVKKGFLNATDLADYLTKKGIPFRESHHITGQIVGICEKMGSSIEDLSLSQLKSLCPQIESDIYEKIKPIEVVETKVSYGSTSQKSIEQSIENGKAILNKYKK